MNGRKGGKGRRGRMVIPDYMYGDRDMAKRGGDA